MDGKHYGYYKKKTYTTSRSIQQAISKKHFDRDIKITERVPYSIYYQACDFHHHIATSVSCTSCRLVRYG